MDNPDGLERNLVTEGQHNHAVSYAGSGALSDLQQTEVVTGIDDEVRELIRETYGD